MPNLKRDVIPQSWSNDREGPVPHVLWFLILGLRAGTGQRSVGHMQVNSLRLFPEGNMEQFDVISCRLGAEF